MQPVEQNNCNTRPKMAKNWPNYGYFQPQMANLVILWLKTYIFIKIRWLVDCSPLLSSFEDLEVALPHKFFITLPALSEQPVPLQYFAFSYILIFCSLHLHEFSYDSQIHNFFNMCKPITFFRVFFFHFVFFYDLHDSEVGVYDTLCIPPVLESILPKT